MKAKLQTPSLEELNKFAKNTILEVLDIKITGVGEDYLEATMPVDKRTHQVYGILHGGASVVLAETLGSMGAMLTIDQSKFHCVGIDINANHIKAVKTGLVTGRATPIHTGRSTQVWGIEIKNDAGEIVCISRITMAVVPH
ncbi:MAG TPA: hotdog fold thioesterase [Bacteroidia bacterium]|jgi:1,4-dihydroxy-2-naphthoyl-CoA hydrolase|nr:hotdog fold thioesterase [Bacteroidia bacterium]